MSKHSQASSILVEVHFHTEEGFPEDLACQTLQAQGGAYRINKIKNSLRIELESNSSGVRLLRGKLTKQGFESLRIRASVENRIC